VAGTTGLGTVTPSAGAALTVTGNGATGQLGTLGAAISVSVSPTGVQGDTQKPAVIVWGRIVPSPGTAWTEVAA
jgi:hypothetical protein